MEPASAVPESAARVATDLRATVSRLRRRLKEVDDSELTLSQTSLLSRLSKDGETTASVLAAAERVRPQSIAATLVALEEQGLVQRRPDPTDGRRQVVSLTTAGVAMLDHGRRQRQAWLERTVAERFTEAERRTILDVLALLQRLVDE